MKESASVQAEIPSVLPLGIRHTLLWPRKQDSGKYIYKGQIIITYYNDKTSWGHLDSHIQGSLPPA